MGDHNGAIAAAAITTVGGIIVALITTGAIGGDDKDSGPPSQSQPTMTFPSIPVGTRTSLFSNRDSGPGGTRVVLSGEGFAPNEKVTFRLHVQEIGRTTANAEGRFSNVTVSIPTTYSKFAPQQFDLVADGESPANHATTPFTVTG
ncbi:MAG TPA: hypothetical protein VM938_11555 [Acidimicrobiales bacterium]|nr:hypothetical protein [Acidimicrobiales bacterium]